MILDVDLQTHTSHSPACGWMAPETLVRRAAAVGLDGVAVTDHNTMDGVEPALSAASDDLLVVPAEEVDTPEGQVIGLFLSEPIEPWGSPESVIDEIHDQGGLVLVPHPFDAMREGLRTIEAHADRVDAVEALNSRCVRGRYNERARAFAESHGLPATGGSDAHFAREVGTAFTRVEVPDADGRDLTSLKRAIEAGSVRPAGRKGSVAVHFGTKAVKLRNRIRRG